MGKTSDHHFLAYFDVLSPNLMLFLPQKLTPSHNQNCRDWLSPIGPRLYTNWERMAKEDAQPLEPQVDKIRAIEISGQGYFERSHLRILAF